MRRGGVVPQRGQALLQGGQGHDLPPAAALDGRDLGQAHQAPGRPGHRVPGGPTGFGPGVGEEAVPEVDHAQPAGLVVARTDGEEHVAGPLGHGPHQLELVARPAFEVEHGLEDPAAGVVHAVGQRQVLVVGGVGAGHLAAVRNGVDQDPRGRVADGTPGDGLGHDVPHPVQFGDGGLLALLQRPLAHHLVADDAVADEADDVERRVQALDRVEVLRVGGPVPGDPVEDGVAGMSSTLSIISAR